MTSVHAATDVQKVIDETYVQPEYVLGSSLSEEPEKSNLSKLGYDASKTPRYQNYDTWYLFENYECG